MAKKRKNHRQFVLNREKVPIDRVFPGMIIEFQYRSEGGIQGTDKGDPRPMFFVLAKERQKRLLHGINLNYLPQHVLQRMFTLISKKVSVDYIPEGTGFNFIRGAYTRVNIPLGNKIIPKNIYEQIIKPKILDVSDDYQAYRTYKISKIGTSYVLNYKLNIHLDNIKKSLEAQQELLEQEKQKLLEEENQRELTRKEQIEKEKLEKEVKQMNKMMKKSARKLPKESMKKMMKTAASQKLTKKGMDKKIDKKTQKKSTKPIKPKTKRKVKKVKTVRRKTTKKK